MPSILYYLGAPYSDPDPAVIDTRVSVTNDFVVHALLQGADIISPITQSHELARKYNLRNPD
jgi:hypothetical protein